MEQRDYLMRQIEMLGQVLAKALARLLNIKQLQDPGLSLEELNEIYGEDMDLSLDLIMETPKEKIVEVLQSRVKFIDHHLDKMAELLSETAELYAAQEEKDARDLREKAIIIYEYLQTSTGEYSLDRVTRIGRIRENL